MRIVFILLLTLSISLFAKAQNVVVTGKIIDEKGYPVISASVIEVGTRNGTVTDTAGVYKLKVSKLNCKLLFSAVGYNQRTVKVKKTTININLVDSPKELLEACVRMHEAKGIGYFGLEANRLVFPLESRLPLT